MADLRRARVCRSGGASAQGERDDGAWPKIFNPQQAIVPVLVIAQLWLPPALTAVYVPATTAVRSAPLLPQQTTAPLARRPQVCSDPASNAVNVPVCAARRSLALRPQQSLAPALVNPHVC